MQNNSPKSLTVAEKTMISHTSGVQVDPLHFLKHPKAHSRHGCFLRPFEEKTVQVPNVGGALSPKPTITTTGLFRH